jgi:hypothetical protein
MWFSTNYDICTTWSIVEIKTRFESWIKRNDVNGVSLYNLPYLITLMVICAHNGHQMWKSTILFLIGRSTDYLR